jgi:hypothetical protein
MIKYIKLNFLSLLFTFASTTFLAQTAPEAPKKEEDEFAKKKVETKITEVIPTDSIAASELLVRAVAWIKSESDRYKKSSGTSTGSKVECSVSFPVKPRELNPEVEYTGKFTMKVVIECKDSKYRYTVSDIKHLSKSGNTNGGSIDNVVAECGSMGMNDKVWKRLKGEALKDAALVVTDLKIGMTKLIEPLKPEEW